MSYLIEVWTVLIFVLGLIVGSFLNVLVDRPKDNENPFLGRSHCDYCKKALTPIELIPLLSFLFLKGKCKTCRKKLSLYYPAVELATAIMFAATFLWLSKMYEYGYFQLFFFIPLLLILILVSVLIVIFFKDLKFGLIPFKAVVLGVIVVGLLIIFFPVYDIPLTNYLYSAIGSFISFLALFLVTRGKGIGFGDVVFVFLMGLILGFPKIILGFYISFVSGAFISLILIFLKIKKLKGDSIPFGPFLIFGTIVSLFWGEYLISVANSYLH